MSPVAERAARLDAHVRRSTGAAIAELAELCRIPSVAGRDDMGACARAVAEALRARGFAVEVVETPGSPIVLGELGAGDRTLLLYNHYDVQPEGRVAEWTSGPFEPELRDGRLFARGAADDKGHIVSRLAALDAVLAEGGALPFRLVWMIDGEEEIGSPSFPAFIAAHRDRLRADACIWEVGGVDDEGRPTSMLGVRGVVGIELSVRTMTEDVHSGEQSYMPNAAWRLVWALASLKGPDERIRVPGFYDDVVAPTARQLELLHAAPSQEAAERRRFGVRRFAGGLTGDAWREAVFRPTCSINGLTSGYQGPGEMTVIPARASAKLDLRLAVGQDPADVVRKLRAYLDAEGFDDVDLHAGPGGMPAAVVDGDHPFVGLVAETAEEVYGEPMVLTPICGGSGPLAFVVDALDVPVADVGVAYPGCLGHAPDEHIRLTDFIDGTRHMTRVLDRFADLDLRSTA